MSNRHNWLIAFIAIALFVMAPSLHRIATALEDIRNNQQCEDRE